MDKQVTVALGYNVEIHECGKDSFEVWKLRKEEQTWFITESLSSAKAVAEYIVQMDIKKMEEAFQKFPDLHKTMQKNILTFLFCML